MKGIDFNQLFLSSGILMLIAFAISLLSGYPQEVGGIGIKAVVSGISAGVILFMVITLIGRYLLLINQSYRDLLLNLQTLFANLSWTTIIIISIMAGVSEELLFRGVIQSYLINVSTPLVGLVVSALLFGLMHFYNRIYIVLTFIIGLLIGWIYYQTQSLLLIMILHCVYDILAFASIVKYPHWLGLEPL